jgi:Ser/Thr protein kinase RdoA (MazF antagonist)
LSYRDGNQGESGRDGADPCAFFEAFLKQQYGEQRVQLSPLHRYPIPGRGIFRVERVRGPTWVLRAYRQGGDADATDWSASLTTRAATLRFLEREGYPAPRVVATRHGGLIGAYAGWHALVTTFIDGAATDERPATLRAIAEATGCLHTLSPARAATAMPPVPLSWMHPDVVVPEALAHLARVAPLVPSELREHVEGFRAVLARFRTLDLPYAVIHGDCWTGNAIVAPGGAILVDWDGAGLGPAVLDLAFLLTTSQPDTALASSRPIAGLVAAVLDGYTRHRPVTDQEEEALADAIRFGAAFHGTRHLVHLLAAEYNNSIAITWQWPEDAWLRKLLARAAAADALARATRAA